MDKSIEEVTRIINREALGEQRYEILKVLGEGAGGVVYLARDLENHGRFVAVKLLTNKSAFDENTFKRFTNEADVAQDLRHPNIVEGYEYFEGPLGAGFVMEYVDAQDLSAKLMDPVLSYEDIDDIFIQTLSGLRHAHDHSVFHRDLKLENILLAKDGSVKITDFGLMKRADSPEQLTRTGVLLGTAQYMPPEYIKHTVYDERGDIFSCGVMLFELCSKSRWLHDKQGMEALEYIIRNRFPTPDLSAYVIDDKYKFIIKKALSLDPEDRFQNVDEMRQAFISSEPWTLFKSKKESKLLRYVKENLRSFFKLFALVAAAAVLFVLVNKFLVSKPSDILVHEGSYVGTIELYGDTGYFKDIKATVSRTYIKVESTYEYCSSALIELPGLVGNCDGGGIVKIEEAEYGRLSGLVFNGKDQTRNEFELLAIK